MHGQRTHGAPCCVRIACAADMLTPTLRHLSQVVMVVLIVSAPAVDAWVARQQRRQLGLCEECGGVNDPATCRQARCPRQRQQPQQQP